MRDLGGVIVSALHHVSRSMFTKLPHITFFLLYAVIPMVTQSIALQGKKKKNHAASLLLYIPVCISSSSSRTFCDSRSISKCICNKKSVENEWLLKHLSVCWLYIDKSVEFICARPFIFCIILVESLWEMCGNWYTGGAEKKIYNEKYIFASIAQPTTEDFIILICYCKCFNLL